MDAIMKKRKKLIVGLIIIAVVVFLSTRI